jgi:excisionase family DNA binding protein
MVIDLENGNLLTVGQVSKILHIHPNTVRRWSNSGILTAYRISKRGDRRFKKEEVTLLFESWLLDYRIESYKQRDKLAINA